MPTRRLIPALVLLALTLGSGEMLIAATGQGASPVAKPVTVRTFAARENFDQWVSLEGFVLRWNFQAPDLQLQLVTHGGTIDARIAVPADASLPARLHGAAVRLTGKIGQGPGAGRLLLVPSLQQLDVKEAGTADIFEAPTVSIAAVMQRRLKGGRRWRVQGVLAACIDPRTNANPTAAGVTAGGNNADLLGATVAIPGGNVVSGGATFLGTISDGSTFSGTFVNRLGQGYSPLDGFGFIDAQNAVNQPVP